VTNPKEILESIDVKAEDTIKKKQWSHFNLSFSNHPLQDPAFGSFSMIEVKQQQSEFSTSLFNLSNDTSRMVHQG
jgi:carotenoid cleavage dioxygenase-like enzyme